MKISEMETTCDSQFNYKVKVRNKINTIVINVTFIWAR